MAVPSPSSLSTICKALASYLSGEINKPEQVASVVIGTPSDAQPADTDTDHKINLFFYKFEPFGFRPDILPGETDWLRVHCLMTPFGVTEGNVNSGEIDLRLLGEIMRVFHEKPVQKVKVDDVDYHIQTIPQALGMEELNQVWSTQGDVPYRASVSYEMALAPIVPKVEATPSPWVGAVGTEVVADLGHRFDDVAVLPQSPLVGMLAVNTSNPGWSPAICMVHENIAIQSQVFKVGDAALQNFKAKVLLAGAPGSKLTLEWHVWTQQDGWNAQAVGQPDPTEFDAKTELIDPDNIKNDQLVEVEPPHTDKACQMVLYAIRSRTVLNAEGKEIEESLKSNPVMITLYKDAP